MCVRARDCSARLQTKVRNAHILPLRSVTAAEASGTLTTSAAKTGAMFGEIDEDAALQAQVR
jgi:hypothetical protein